MSKHCAKCEKVVYSLEELKCLDKIWHKTCFRCWECGMTLNMKNYKGYDKKPYCNAHYPTLKFTAVADTPEMNRLGKNTKMQSQIKYHEDFEKNIKGTKIQVCDDPETQRLKAASMAISQVEYKGLKQKAAAMESHRSNIGTNSETGKRVGDYDPSRVGGVKMTPPPEPNAVPSPMSSKNKGHSITYSSKGKVEQDGPKRVGSIHDYDPLNERFGSLNTGYLPTSSLKQTAQWEETTPTPQAQNNMPHQHYPAPQHNQVPPQSVAPPPQSVAPPPQPMAPPQQSMAPPPQQMAPPPQAQPVAPVQPPPAQPVSMAPPPANQPPPNAGPIYQAMYDYEAQDDDEIGFIENDLIIECQPIDDGWMFGTVKRTGQRGMLPANYVDRVK